MADESQILSAMFYAVKAIGLPTAYPGSKFTPPTSGQWLELEFLPNDDIADPVNVNSGNVAQGMFRVIACNRQNTGLIPLANTATTVKDAFPLGSDITGQIRVSEWPVAKDLDAADGVMRIAVTVKYAS